MGAAMQSDQTAEESMMRKTDLALQNDFVIWQIPSNFMSLKLRECIWHPGIAIKPHLQFPEGRQNPEQWTKVLIHFRGVPTCVSVFYWRLGNKLLELSPWKSRLKGAILTTTQENLEQADFCKKFGWMGKIVPLVLWMCFLNHEPKNEILLYLQ